MKTKPKIFIFTGPIAAGKTYLATACAGSGRFSYLNFDTCCYKNGTILPPNESIDNVVDQVKQIEQNGESGSIVIDGWFSFTPSWWTKEISYDTISELDSKLAFAYEIIPVTIFRKPAILLADIHGNPAKYKYPDYQNHLERIYNFLFNAIFGWWKDDGKSKTTPASE